MLAPALRLHSKVGIFRMCQSNLSEFWVKEVRILEQTSHSNSQGLEEGLQFSTSNVPFETQAFLEREVNCHRVSFLVILPVGMIWVTNPDTEVSQLNLCGVGVLSSL